MQAGTKVNVIPDRVHLQVDIRTLPGWGQPEVEAMINDALGDLAGDVELTWNAIDVASTSPTDTPLWDALERVARASYPDARCVPFLTVGATDARFFRRLGTVAYGFGLFSEQLVVRAVRDDVPRRRRAGRRGLARAVGRAVGRARPAVAAVSPPGRPGTRPVAAVLFDFGGRHHRQPLRRLRRYERDHGLPDGFIRSRERHQPSRQRLGPPRAQRARVRRVLRGLRSRDPGGGRPRRRPRPVRHVLGAAPSRDGRGRRGAVASTSRPGSSRTTSSPRSRQSAYSALAEVLALFDAVVESSVVGVRKPDERFYLMACEALDVAPRQAVFLDDLGVNLKPARALGMATIKVTDTSTALTELEAVVGIALR